MPAPALEKIRSVLLGLAVGDALGVPVEFRKREVLRVNPVKNMRGHGVHDQPAGTFSDDSSLAFCLAEALTSDFELNKVANNFVRWRKETWWTAHGEVFDVGNTIDRAICNLYRGEDPLDSGFAGEYENGNGSLMRIAPLLFYIWDKPAKERFNITRQISAITHAHERSIIACFYYMEFAREILEGKDKFETYEKLKNELPDILQEIKFPMREMEHFSRLIADDIFDFDESQINSSGYVIDTLEASIWCLLTTNNYKKAVLKAVNLGDDSDTTGAVTGALAGLLYGTDSIPKEWLTKLARYEDIEDLSRRLFSALGGQ